ncbi:MAG TPA: NAD-dependent succinate-semialdehyde dehydrogenase [Acidisarcina sp.]
MTYQSTNPSNGEVVRTFIDHTDSELDYIIDVAANAYANVWRHKTMAERGAIVSRAAALLREQRDSFATLATLEMGKLRKEALVEVELCAAILDYYSKNASAFLAPKPITVDRGEALVVSEPLGVLFCVEPWNFPYYQLARVAGPNLMTGNTLIVKHAPNVPQCALAFEKLFTDAGAPAGVYSNVFLSNEQSAIAIADSRIRGVALTGSERAGSAVASEAGSALKKSTMELGGSDPFIVLNDADLDLAVEWAVRGRFHNAGQSCIAAKRFILVEEIADEFLSRFVIEAKKLVPGDPNDNETTLAPLCSSQALMQAESQIQEAIAGGAKVLLGGKRIDRVGCFLEPTILTNISSENPAYYQEFFSPVALVFRVENETEAARLANDSPYGLGGSIFTRDIERGKSLAHKIDSGMVYINQVPMSAPNLPFGGVRNSGFGRELSDLGIAEFVNKKLIRVA